MCSKTTECNFDIGVSLKRCLVKFVVQEKKRWMAKLQNSTDLAGIVFALPTTGRHAAYANDCQAGWSHTTHPLLRKEKITVQIYPNNKLGAFDVCFYLAKSSRLRAHNRSDVPRRRKPSASRLISPSLFAHTTAAEFWSCVQNWRVKQAPLKEHFTDWSCTLHSWGPRMGRLTQLHYKANFSSLSSLKLHSLQSKLTWRNAEPFIVRPGFVECSSTCTVYFAREYTADLSISVQLLFQCTTTEWDSRKSFLQRNWK